MENEAKVEGDDVHDFFAGSITLAGSIFTPRLNTYRLANPSIRTPSRDGTLTVEGFP